MANAKQFNAAINARMANIDANLNTIVRTVALQGLQRLVEKTPVDTGRARSNWFVDIGDPQDQGVAEPDKSGGSAVARGGAVIAGYANANGLPEINIHNTLPYIGRLENGYSSQAPGGMLALTVAELQTQGVK